MGSRRQPHREALSRPKASRRAAAGSALPTPAERYAPAPQRQTDTAERRVHRRGYPMEVNDAPAVIWVGRSRVCEEGHGGFSRLLDGCPSSDMPAAAQ